MNNLKEMYMEQVEADYAEYIESQNQALRREGAEELRIGILRSLESAKEFASAEMLPAFDKAIDYVKRATI
jgi:uncharacterized protein YdhG (YjbR/CyaY superfamily)